MGLLSYDPMEDGEEASANLWNVRLSAIHDLLNGNIDAANLANGAVTSAKIADGAVTSAKMDVDKYIDDNGWTVEDYGSTKNYSIRKTGVANLPHQTWVKVVDMPLPQGIASIDSIYISMATMAEMAEAVFTIVPSQSVGKVVVYMYNAHPSNNNAATNWRIDFLAKEQ